MNEREKKLGVKAADDAICSTTGKRCRCGDSGRCESRLGEPKLDKVPVQTVRHLRSATIMLSAALEHLDAAIGQDFLLVRKFPGPEVREVRRKVVTAIAMIDEIGGEL